MQNGTSSLMTASEKGHVEVVYKLLLHGANVDLREEVFSFAYNIRVSILCM